MEQEETTQRAEKPKKKRPWLGLSIFVVVVIVLFFGINYFLVHNDIKEAQKQSDSLAAQIDYTSGKLEDLQNKPETITKAVVEFANAEKIDLTAVFAAVMKDAPSDAALTGVAYDANGLQFKMNFSTLQDATTYEKALVKNTDVFETVTLDKVAAYTPVSEDELASKPDISSTARYQAVLNVTLNKEKLQQTAQQAADKEASK
jgi:hypothetical protein